MFPRSSWNSNWDFREPLSLVDRESYAKAGEESRKEMLEKLTPTSTRNIILVRHGQYHLDSKKKNLTDLGREQAILLAERLENMEHTIDSIVMSTMYRAVETAQLIINCIQYRTNVTTDAVLQEGLPCQPEPASNSFKPSTKSFVNEGARIEAAFQRYIHRSSINQKKDTWEVIVCHSNVIRYFVCRALQFPQEGWRRFSLGHCSVTIMSIKPNGRVFVRSVGDIGHLPKGKATIS